MKACKSHNWKDELQPLRVKTDLNGQCAQHLPVHLNRGIGVAFYPHPVGHLNTHVRVKADKSTSERGKLPQSN
jgi:hypothetical protein